MKKILIALVASLLFVTNVHADNCSAALTGAFVPAQAVAICTKLGAFINVDWVFSTGKTISLQEGTAASACMGAATPNGNTAVAVTTTCAVSGARVFYSRAGAITNMGVITTTTAPSGTGFSFASTGASDATASSVIWLIVKEAA